MAKDYRKGHSYKLYLDTADTWAMPTWVEIKAAGDIDVDEAPDDIAIPERSGPTRHMQGEEDPEISFTLFEDVGDANVATLRDAIRSGDQVHIAIAEGDITVEGVRYCHLEAVLFAPQSMARGDVSQWPVSAREHGNSDNVLTWATVPAP